MPISAEGWFVHAAGPDEAGRPAELRRETFELSDPEPHEVLVEPLFGSWEANMQNAIERQPIDVCAVRGDERAIIGNAGVARVLAWGSEVEGLEEGQPVLMFGLEVDRFGYPVRVMGYDSALSGFLATRIKLHRDHLIPIPEGTRYSLEQWAAFNNRYVTAWANWRVALGTFRLLVGADELERLQVWTWGGGTGLAEVQLAAKQGHAAVALASSEERLALVRDLGVQAVDRTPFRELAFDPRKYGRDEAYTKDYQANERRFLETVHEVTGGEGVQIFVETIGVPVFRATTKALSRHGILTTVGWKAGMQIAYLRALETIERHQFIHTHYARRREAEDAVAFAEENDWMPVVDERVYSFDEVPQLAEDYASGNFRMFPIYRVAPE